MAWVKIPASNSLFAEFNAAFPNRDKASDGTIGDGEHSQSSSDHNPDETGKTPSDDSDSINEVHAADVDSDLRRAGWSMQRVVDIIVARCQSGAEKRLLYIIYNRRIISRSWEWKSWHDYDGPSPHTEHAHFSFRYGSGSGTANPENITSPWGFLAAVEAEDDMTEAELIAALKKWAKDPNGLEMTTGNRSVAGTLNALAVAIGQDAARDAEILAKTDLDADETAAIADAVVAKLGSGATPAAKADLLRAALGADAAEVGRLLAA